MAPLHRPGTEPGKNAIKAIGNVASRGYPANWLAGDRAYSSAKPEDFQLPARSLGYKPVFDYKIDQLGVKVAAEGFIQVEGAWYCPSMPQPLIDATADLRGQRISDEVYAVRIEERKKYRAKPKASADADGHVRLQCPAAGDSPSARCPLKPNSQRNRKPVRVTIRPTHDVAANPPKACVQQSITMAPVSGAKFHQELAYGTPEWHEIYSTLRNANEGMNGFVKDGAHEALSDPGKRRIRGRAAQSVFVALLLFAANVRKIEAFIQQERAIADGAVKRLPRRRRSRGLSEFKPALEGIAGPAPPKPG